MSHLVNIYIEYYTFVLGKLIGVTIRSEGRWLFSDFSTFCGLHVSAIIPSR